MFLNKNKTNDLIDLSQFKELRPDDIPIHTMLGDLNNLEHPEKKVQEEILEKAPLPPKKGALSDVQTDSPFLSGKPPIESLASIKSKVPPPPIPAKNELKEEKIASFFSAKQKIDSPVASKSIQFVQKEEGARDSRHDISISNKPRMDVSAAPEPAKDLPKKEGPIEIIKGRVFSAKPKIESPVTSKPLKFVPKKDEAEEVRQDSYFSIKPKMDLSAAPNISNYEPKKAAPFPQTPDKKIGSELPRPVSDVSIRRNMEKDVAKDRAGYTSQAEKGFLSYAQIKQEVEQEIKQELEQEIKQEVKDLVGHFPKPEKGKMPRHEWNEDRTRIRFENSDGTWGEWSDILKGKDGKVVRYDGSMDDKSPELTDAPKSYSDSNGKSQETVIAPTYSAPPADPIRMDEEIINTEPPALEPKLSDIFTNSGEKTMYIPTDKTPAVSNIGKIIGSIAVVLIIIILGGGSYYYWMIRQDKPIDVAPPTPPVEIPVEPEPIPPINTSKFNLDKPNYLQIDISENSTTEGVKNSILKYVQDIKEEKIIGPLEFLVTDKENSPVSFQVFAQKMGIGLSNNILAAFENSFSLFVYSDNGNYRIGLALNTKEGFDLSKLMLTEEPKLISELKNLFLDLPYTEPKIMVFSSGTYNTYPVRYLNITSPQELSLDYTILNKKLVLGTTMLTNRSIIDYILKASPETKPTPSVSSTPK